MTECEKRKEEKIQYIVEKCIQMRKKEKLTITDFGKRKDLKLYIWKNDKYNQETNENNTVRIETKQLTEIADKTGEISLENLSTELNRIYCYKNFSE